MAADPQDNRSSTFRVVRPDLSVEAHRYGQGLVGRQFVRDLGRARFGTPPRYACVYLVVPEAGAVRAEADERARLLQSMPGIGLYSALAISSRIGDIERFRHPDSLANYWGLTPSSNNSGDNKKRLGSITKQGSKIVRHLLGQAVVKVLRFDMAMRKWYKRIKKRRGSIFWIF